MHLKSTKKIFNLVLIKILRKKHISMNSIKDFIIMNLQATKIELIEMLINTKKPDRKSTRLNSSHVSQSRMPSSA